MGGARLADYDPLFELRWRRRRSTARRHGLRVRTACGRRGNSALILWTPISGSDDGGRGARPDMPPLEQVGRKRMTSVARCTATCLVE